MPKGVYKRVKKINYPKDRESPPCSVKKKEKISIAVKRYAKEHPERYSGGIIEKMRNSMIEGYKNGRIRVNSGCFKKGDKLSEEVKTKIGLAVTGNKHPNWQGGKSFEEYGREFDSSLKEQIRFRDGYKCKLCGCSQVENGRELDIHHKDYNKKNNVSSNLLSLCKSCHMKTNGRREYWIKFFKEVNSDDARGRLVE